MPPFLKKTSALSGFFRSTLLLCNIGAIIWLLICKWASFYDPSGKPSILSLFSFSCFFALLANIVFIIIWLFSKKKLRLLYSLIVIILSWTMIRPLIGLNFFGSNKTDAASGDLKIMTWNVHLFDLGEWTKDETSKAKIIQLIQEENPDILCLEEFYWDKNNNTAPYTAIIQQLGYPYVAFSNENSFKKRRLTSSAGKHDIIETGNAVFSKFPLRNEHNYYLGRDNYKMLSVEVIVDSSHIFNLNVVHLTSVRFGEKELAYISEVQEKGVNAQDKDKSKSLLKKLMNAFAHRALLANSVDSLKRFMDYPIIICGDFNDVPGSYAYETVKGDLADAFSKKGAGLGRTYRNIFPTLRIDYLLYDPSALKAEGYLRRNVGLSDHFPVIANFSFINGANDKKDK